MDHPYGFFHITGETPETMLSMLDEMSMLFHRNKREEHKLSPRNRVLLYLLCIRTYPSYQMLSILFRILCHSGIDGQVTKEANKL
jgi:hypothetical protein